MVGGKSGTMLGFAHGQSANDSALPPYSEVDADRASSSSAFMAETTTTTVTTTTQTTTFFSLPLWRRRAAPSMSTAVSEGPHRSAVRARATEDGRIARATSYNIDFNKDLPDVPRDADAVDPLFARRSTGTMHFPTRPLETAPSPERTRPSRASTLMPPQSQSTYTLAQAGLGIGLSHVMPSVAGATPRGPSTSASARPSTAPRPTRTDISPAVRRVKSFSRSQSELAAPQPKRKASSSQLHIVPSDNDSGVLADENPSSSSPSTRSESRSLIRRASFWTRRRVQSFKGPNEPQSPSEQTARLSPAPALPAFQPISPMFPDKPIQSSPGSTPQSANFQPPAKLRRRHSERSTSMRRSSRNDPASLGPDTSSPARPAQRHRPQTANNIPNTIANGNGLPLQEPQARPIHMSFVTSPAISRFPVLDERQNRPRSMTNPPNVLSRFSMGIFSSSSPSSPISSPTVSTNITDNISSSPRQSGTFTRSSLSKSAVEIPKPRADEEPPEEFLGRLEEAVSKAEIANILAASGDSYYNQALQLYIDRFDFANDPLDIALRKLLMDVGLPKETQQIDRVMEAFAARYTKCNPDLFVSQDHPYILAFSLIMLHTDAFNKSNKRKMTKADYVKNTKLVGVSTDVLEYFFDNIIFAPFIFIEDPLDVNGQRGFTQDGRMQSLASGQMTPNPSGSGLSILGKSNKVDAYYLITRNLLGSLRVDVESHIPLRNPYSYQGTAGSWNEAELRRSFARADIIEVDATDTRRMSTLPFFSLNATGAPGPMLNNFVPPTSSDEDSVTSQISALRVTKVGLLNRKDDLLDGGKRASSRKWKEWSIILTGSQLLFYRDTAVALNLVIQSQSPESEIFPTQPSYLRPDELLSVKDAVAVYDSSYIKRDYVVRLVMPSGRHILLQTENEIQRNEWIAHINYASAFKTAGIRMRPVSAKEDARMDRSSYTSDAPQIPGENDASKLDSPVEDTRNSMLRISSDMVQDNYTSFSQVRSSSMEGHSSGQSRSRIVLSKIRDFESRIDAARTQLDSDIRLVHNLAILTPFQRSTRDRLQASVINLGRHIKQLRLEIVKATCFRDVLAADLASEERERKIRKTEDMALAANRYHGRNNSVPTMVLSVHENDPAQDTSGRTSSRSDLSDLSHGQNDSSICESFHSALDFGSDWPRSIRITVGNQRNMASSRTLDPNSPLTTPSHEVPPGGFNGSSFFSSSSPLEPSSGRASFSSPSIGTDKSPVIAPQISEEQAEEWDKTRAARRVSLVKVPASLKASNRDGRREVSWVTQNNDGSRLSEEGRRRSDESTRTDGLQPERNT